MRKYLVLLLLLLAGVACQRGGIFKTEEVRFEKSQGPCQGETSPCAKVELIYPRLSGGAAGGRDKLSAEIQGFVFRQIDETVAKDAEAYAAAFFAEYQKFGQEFPKAPQSWWENRQVKVLVNSPKIFSLSSEWEGYMGGAHPNTRVDFRSYDPKSGKRYGLGDWLKPGYEKPLQALGEKAFRKARELPADADLNDAGFTFEEGFKLNDNFAAGPEGLIFYFNPYEVASYVDGPTEFVIPYTELKDWLLARGPLDSLTKK